MINERNTNTLEKENSKAMEPQIRNYKSLEIGITVNSFDLVF